MRFLILSVAAALTFFCSWSSSAQSLYWEEIVPGAGPGGNSAGIQIKRANLNGSGAAVIADTVTDGLKYVHSIASEPVSNTIFWSDQNAGRIQRANPDGSNVQTVVTVTLVGQPSSVRGLAIDSTHSTMYWTDELYQTISRANLDGSGITAVVSSVVSDDMAIDVAANRMLYVTNVGGAEGPHDGIGTANLDGSGAHSIVSGLFQVTAVDVDPIAHKVYWADVGLNALNDTSIHRANYDGSGAQTLLSNLPDVIIDMDVVPELNAIYWTSRDDGTIKRSDLNGGSQQTVISGLSLPEAILVVVPEPASWVLVCLGAIGFGLVRARRKALSDWHC